MTSRPPEPLAADASATSSRLPLALASAATFLAFLDVTIVNVAFADLRSSFPTATLATLSWTITGYALAFAALLAPLGRLADTIGRIQIFRAGLAVFGLASLAAAVAPNLELLVAARVVQGGGAAAMIPSALAIVLAATEPERRVRAVGSWAAAGSLAAAVGPVLGGVLVEVFGWRSTFWVNVPLTAALVVATGKLPVLARGSARLPHPIGVLTITVGLAAVVGGFAQTGPWGWGDVRALGLIVGGTVVTVGALLHAWRSDAPAVDVQLLRVRRLATAVTTSALIGAALFSWLLFGVLFLTRIWDYSVLEPGLASGPGSLFSVVGSVIAARHAERGRAGLLIAVGGVLMAGVAVVLATATPESPHYLAFWLPAGAVSGVGIAFMIVGASAVATAATPPEAYAAGTGLMIASRQVGGAVGVAIAASLLVQPPELLQGFRYVFAACGVMAALTVLTGLALARTSNVRSALTVDDSGRLSGGSSAAE